MSVGFDRTLLEQLRYYSPEGFRRVPLAIILVVEEEIRHHIAMFGGSALESLANNGCQSALSESWVAQDPQHRTVENFSMIFQSPIFSPLLIAFVPENPCARILVLPKE